jgi:hypothetical protein
VNFDPRQPASAAIVVRAALGDRASLDHLLRAIQTPLYEHISFILNDRDAASDVLQDVLITVCRSLIGLTDPTRSRRSSRSCRRRAGSSSASAISRSSRSRRWPKRWTFR